MLDLGDLVPETKPIRLNRIVGKTVNEDGTINYALESHVFHAYVYGPRCPVLVKSALRQVVQKAAREQQEQGGYSDDIFQRYARDSFMQLIPGLSLDEADLLAADDDGKSGKCIKTLMYLNYWQDTAPTEGNSEEDPNSQGEEASTTQKSSPISA